MPHAGDSSVLRVTTFNVRNAGANDGANAWPRRLQLAVDTVRAHDADIHGFQEVLHVQRSDLVTALPDYTFIGVGRDDGDTAGEYAPIMFRTSRFEITDGGTIWLSANTEAIGKLGWDAVCPRIATWIILRDKHNGRQTAVFNAHFDHVGVAAREESAKLLLARVEAIALPCIVMGDFNCEETDAPCLTLSTKLVDAYRQAHPEAREDEASFHDFKGHMLGRRIDFIFTKGFRATEAAIDRANDAGRFPSDHFPVWATLVPVDSVA